MFPLGQRKISKGTKSGRHLLQRCLLEPINLSVSASKTRVDLKLCKVHKSSDDRKCKTEFGKKKNFREQQDIPQYRPMSSQRQRKPCVNHSEIFIKPCYTQANERNQRAKNLSQRYYRKDRFFNKKQKFKGH